MRVRPLAALLLALVLVWAASGRGHADPPATPPLWVTAYYASYHQGRGARGLLPPEAIDYSALTHLIHFCVVPATDGTVSGTNNSLTDEKARAIVASAHAHAVKVLICVGGENTRTAFVAATAPAMLDTFVRNLLGFMDRLGYDGVDLDWEPLRHGDAPQYQALVARLRTEFDRRNPKPLLTAAVDEDPTVLAPLQDRFDQINLMAYDQSGPYPGWVTWHNAPLDNGGFTFRSGRPFPSVDRAVTGYTGAGIDPRRVGLGLPFYAQVWSAGTAADAPGPTSAREGWPPDAPDRVPRMRELGYADLVARYYRPETYRWDRDAQAPYLSVSNPDPHQNLFISYDDATSIHQKVAYARRKGLGGVMIFELAQDHDPTATPTDPLLQAVKSAVFGP